MLDSRTQKTLDIMAKQSPRLAQVTRERLEAPQVVMLARYEWAALIGSARGRADDIQDPEFKATIQRIAAKCCDQLGIDTSELDGGK